MNMNMNELKSGVVRIDEDYRIRLEDRSYVLCKKRISKGEKTAGQEIEDVIGYFSDFEALFKRYFREQVVNRSVGKDMELKEFMVLVKGIKEDIRAIRKEIDG